MKFVKVDDLQPGMRLARPIYSKIGAMLYERESKLTTQGIDSIRNFGFIGIYILEPAEPAIPLSEKELEFEKFQSIAVFRLKDDLLLLKNNKAPKFLLNLTQMIIKGYGSLNDKIHFIQSVRSAEDYIYKHSLNTAILSAMISQKMRIPYEEQTGIVCAALIHDLGQLYVPPLIQQKGNNLSKAERQQIQKLLQKGYELLHPDNNSYKLPGPTLQIAGQIAKYEHDPSVPLPTNVRWHRGTTILHVAGTYDTLTAMKLNEEPLSELAAINYLKKYPAYYTKKAVSSLSQCIHILPTGCCVDLSDGEKGIILYENTMNFATPVVIRFSDHQVLDFNDPAVASKLQITDVMQTMDTRVPVDEDTLKQFAPDEHTRIAATKYFKQRAKLIAAGREP